MDSGNNFLNSDSEIALSISDFNFNYCYQTKFFFGRRKRNLVFKNMNCQIPVGKIQLIGRSGSGKSTLLMMIHILYQKQVFGNNISSSKFSYKGDFKFYFNNFRKFSLMDEGFSDLNVVLDGSGSSDKYVNIVAANKGIKTKSEDCQYTIYVYNNRIAAYGDTSKIFSNHQKIEGLSEYMLHEDKFED